ncbi:MAG: AAA family ATPase, partial [Bacteroidota bacterium]
MEYRENEQLKLASEFVQFTNRNVFLTGKAGTGKTTFLHHLKKITPKRMVVVAPTGVAAINAGGVTIHSFFQLSFAPAVPAFAQTRNTFNDKEGYKRKFSREKIRLIKCIDLLVIDEISMVRADILDSVDEVLRKYRNRSKPFGGVQLLMIGDLHQLSPVIKDDEWAILRDYYPSVYFFDSHALKNSNPISIELKEIFRQSDKYFIDLLNKVRDNKTDTETISEINTRYIPNFKYNDDEGYITLTTHNAFAAEMNRAKLDEIKTTPYYFTANITGDFPPHDFPNEDKLELKTGAQVMFIRNDLAAERKYYNG